MQLINAMLTPNTNTNLRELKQFLCEDQPNISTRVIVTYFDKSGHIIKKKVLLIFPWWLSICYLMKLHSSVRA